MKILGLHFGHDAGVALVEDGKVIFLAHCERILRQKKTSGISYATLTDILKRAGVRPDQIDFCAITTTQGIDIVLDDRTPFSVELARHPDDAIPSTLESNAKVLMKELGTPLQHILDPISAMPAYAARWEKRIGAIANGLNIPPEHVRTVPTVNRSFLNRNSPIAREASLRQLGDGLSASLDAYREHKFDFNYPATVTLDNHRIPAAFITHHAAHAAATFFQSPFHTAPIMTLDGGVGQAEGGLFWLGMGHEIIPLRLHYLELGKTYLFVAHNVLKLGGSAEGKMMGLAPYGTPAFFDERFVCNSFGKPSDADLAVHWFDHMRGLIAQSPKYTANDLGNAARMTSPVNADIAASTQKLFEETMLVAVDQLARILANVGISTDKLALSGGCMLNCPTNTRISQETPFHDVAIEPACDDGGLPIGAALWVYHHMMGNPRTVTDPVKQGLPYYGLAQRPDDFQGALAAHADQIVVTRPSNIADEGARRLAAGQVVGCFQGRSEIGPRALGHRSIVADPRSAETWQRVNTIKGRELWRPLAPSVLAEKSAAWFSGMPASSPFMMFVGTVTRPDVPAIAHIDSTARVQTVTPECGGYYDLIRRFYDLTGCAVVLNTSMNGPGQPIAEYPADAIGMLLDQRFDVLVLEDMLIERRPS